MTSVFVIENTTYNGTGAAERQDPVFLIGPGNKKPRKKRAPVEIPRPPFQNTSWHFR
jgi:hypothetical protein